LVAVIHDFSAGIAPVVSTCRQAKLSCGIIYISVKFAVDVAYIRCVWIVSYGGSDRIPVYFNRYAKLRMQVIGIRPYGKRAEHDENQKPFNQFALPNCVMMA